MTFFVHYSSHELQTCDWPRNVGCDALGSVDNDEIERVVEHLVERKPKPPPPPPPRRAPLPPPPPQRVQPNPVVTSRGQPKLTRDEYEKVMILKTIVIPDPVKAISYMTPGNVIQ